MTSHDTFLELAAAAVDEPLSAREADALNAHLATCASCRLTAALFRADAARLVALPARSVRPEVRAAVVASLHGPGRRGTRPRTMTLLLAAALALALAGAAVMVGARLQDHSHNDQPLSWTSTTLPDPDTGGSERPAAAAAVGDGVMVVGGGGGGALAWTTTDGLTWDVTTLMPGAGAEATTIAVINGTAIAGGVGTVAPVLVRRVAGTSWGIYSLSGAADASSVDSVLETASGGWAVARRANGGVACWATSDGVDWALATPPPDGTLDVVADGPRGLVALSETGNEVDRSPDGATWTTSAIPGATDGLPGVGRRRLVVTPSGDLLLVGRAIVADASLSAWRSHAGEAWVRVPFPVADGDVAAARVLGGRIVVVTDGSDGPVVADSADGRTWAVHPVVHDPQTRAFDVASLSGARWLVVGTASGAATAWVSSPTGG